MSHGQLSLLAVPRTDIAAVAFRNLVIARLRFLVMVALPAAIAEVTDVRHDGTANSRQPSP